MPCGASLAPFRSWSGSAIPGLANPRAADRRRPWRPGAAAVMIAPPAGPRHGRADRGLSASGMRHPGRRRAGGPAGLPSGDGGASVGQPVQPSWSTTCLRSRCSKHEDCPGLGKITRIRASAQRDRRRRVSILAGNGALYYPLELARGADGAMTGFAFPEVLVKIFERFAAGRTERRVRAVRRVPAPDPLRAAAGHRARDPQGDPASARRARQPHGSAARRSSGRPRSRRAEGPARSRQAPDRGRHLIGCARRRWGAHA